MNSTAGLLKPDDTLVALGPEGTAPVKVADAEEYHRLLARGWTSR